MPKGRLLARGTIAMDLLATSTPGLDAESKFLRIQDIPGLVADGLLDAGVASDEWLADSEAQVVRVAPLCWYHAKICVISGRSPVLGDPVRVVSEFANLARKYAQGRWPDRFVQRTVRGAVEEYLPELADIGIECVETGASIRRRGLRVLDTLFEADVWLVCSPAATESKDTVDALRAWAAQIADHNHVGCSARAGA
jgi:ATP phosphoribosyltransferase